MCSVNHTPAALMEQGLRVGTPLGSDSGTGNDVCVCVCVCGRVGVCLMGHPGVSGEVACLVSIDWPYFWKQPGCCLLPHVTQ